MAMHYNTHIGFTNATPGEVIFYYKLLFIRVERDVPDLLEGLDYQVVR